MTPLQPWLREGLRAAVLRQPRTGGAEASPGQLIALLALNAALSVGLARLEIPGAAQFDLRGWLLPYWVTASAALLAWALLWRPHLSDIGRPPGLSTWFALWTAASLPQLAVNGLLTIAQARDALPPLLQSSTAAWAMYVGLGVWAFAVGLRVAQAVGLRGWRLAALAGGVVALSALADWQFRDRPWEADRADEAGRPRLELSQETFEAQEELLDRALQGIAPQRPGTVDLYGIVFAPYAQDVFKRESAMVAGVLAQRFDAQGRVLQFVNHAEATATLPWATAANLRRAIAAVAARMEREEDVLAIYMTSHGASDFKLAASHWPLQVPPLTPAELRKALDEAGIRRRVIVVSACYSGGWVAPLAGPDTLVMTAADAGHTSYGCGSRSELTFFGRAVFDEQLRKTRSFQQAFTQAVPVIRQREEEGRKPDGFSNPQFKMGERIAPVLDEMARRLDEGR